MAYAFPTLGTKEKAKYDVKAGKVSVEEILTSFYCDNFVVTGASEPWAFGVTKTKNCEIKRILDQMINIWSESTSFLFTF